LRVGYVSPDLYQHSVAFFLEPILAHHDRSRFEPIVYSDTARPDAVTARLRARAAAWHEVRGLSDDQLARRIAASEIDVLIDLAGHTAGNRMGVFARRPAPVQVSYLGYPNTTGLAAIDYRITDATADPPGDADALHTEKLLRLPRCAWCYQPSPLAPPVAPSPAMKNGFVTFGCFNALPKMNDPLLQLWAKLIASVPNARLVLKSPGLKSEAAAAHVRDVLESAGLAADRFDLLPPVHPYAAHLASYETIDIALDTYPYNGTTTTCDALWMGVPVLTRAGRTHVSRVSASLLAAAGLPDWVTPTDDDYLARATRAAADIDALTALRSRLRDRMAASPLCDGQAMARAFEDALLQECRREAGTSDCRA
jgi:predicted O-linked N-acetylglucosamine transferase (SPINDLY family)